MNRLMTNWPGLAEWTAGLEPGGPLRSAPAGRPIDLLDEEASSQRSTPTVQSVEAFDVSEDVGRYLPLGVYAVPFAEFGIQLPPGLGTGRGLYDPAWDEFFGAAGLGETQAHGRLAGGFVELPPVDFVADVDVDVMVTSAADAEEIVDTFVALPHELSALPLSDTEGFDVQGSDRTFGGGDDPVWMLTLLPSADDYVDAGFGRQGPGFDIWG